MVEIQSYKSKGLELATLSCVHFDLSPTTPSSKKCKSLVQNSKHFTGYKNSKQPRTSLIILPRVSRTSGSYREQLDPPGRPNPSLFSSDAKRQLGILGGNLGAAKAFMSHIFHSLIPILYWALTSQTHSSPQILPLCPLGPLWNHKHSIFCLWLLD